jgi:uncharacterized protein YggE
VRTTLLAVIAAALLTGCTTIQVPGTDQRRTVAVTGTAQVAITPDICHINLSVNTKDKRSAAKAYKENNRIAGKIRAAAESLEVEAKDVKSANFTISPVYRWSDHLDRNVFDGYAVSHTLTIQVRDLAIVSDVLDAAVEAGARDVNSVSYTVEHPKQHMGDARLEAMKAARRKAEAFAELNGVRLGKPVTITESEPGRLQPLHAQYRGNAWFDGDQVAIGETGTLAPGQTRLTQTVYVTYELL